MSTGGKGKEPRQKKKPGRVPTACAECRRLKLRCDRNVPCEKCVSRGCGSICPTGELVTGKNNKMILANTEELHDRIDAVSARNRELENALRILQESLSDQPHPLLLEKDVLNLRINTGASSSASSGTSASSSSKSPSTSRISPAVQPPLVSDVKLEDEHNVLEAFGTMMVGRRGESRHLGKTARSEYLAQATSRPAPPQRPRRPRLSKEVALPDSPIRDDDLLSEILDLLPQQSKAQHLCDLYLEYGKYLYSPISRNELLDDILAVVYKAKQYNGFDHFHSLSLLFIVFAIAELFNPETQAYTPEAHEYYNLSRVALQFSPPMYDASLLAIQTLIHMAQYLDLSDSDPSSPESAWIHLGNAIRLAQSVGLHLNSGRWKMSKELSQRRHALFWRLFVVDTWTNAHLGRPSSIPQSQIDIPLPRHTGLLSEAGADAATIFHSWNVHFTFLLHSITETALGPKQPVYSVILDCDRKIRDFEVPVIWRVSADDDSLPLDIAMYRWLVLSAKETALLNLHRGYFAQTLQETNGDLQRHRYLPSVVAIYRSAWRLVRGLATTWRILPKFLSRVNLAWSYGLSAAIVMCLFVTRAPTSHLSTAALDELENLTSLFDSSSSNCRPAGKFLTSVQRLQRKAHEATRLPPTRFPTYAEESPTISLSELDRLNGKTHVFYPDQRRSPSTTSYSGGGASTSASTLHDGARSRATSVTISDIAEGSHIASNLPSPLFHSTDNVHPTLAHDLRDFSLGVMPSAIELALFDFPSSRDASDDMDMSMSLSPAPTTSQETAKAKEPSPPKPARVPLRSQSQPYGQQRQQPQQQHLQSEFMPAQPQPQPPPVSAPAASSQTHYFQTALHHDPQPLDIFSESRRVSNAPSFPLNYIGGGASSGSGGGGSGGIGYSGLGATMSFPPGFQAGGWGSGYAHYSPIMLDSSWTNFVEQLGF